MLKNTVKKFGTLFMAGMTAFGVFMPVSTFAKPGMEKEAHIREVLAPYSAVIEKNYYEKIEDMTGIIDRFIEEIDDNISDEDALRSFVRKIGDPYAEYYTEEGLKSFNKNMAGEFYGIGVEARKDEKTGGVRIMRVFKHSPAAEKGLKKNDIIIKVAGKNVTKMELEEALSLVKGEEGTEVKIVVLRGKKKKTFKVERRKVIRPTVEEKFYKKGKIGYLQVLGFLDNTDEEFDESLDSLEKKKIRGLIIDLRNNGGGYVDTAFNMLNRILPDDKKVFSYLYKGGQSIDFYSETNDGEDEIFSKPIMILMNKASASASEIFAGGLLDNDVAEVIGEKSYGKGVAQNIFRIKEGVVKGAVKLTVLKYFLPLGESIHNTGISPTHIVLNAGSGEKAADEQLKFALKKLRK